MIFQVPREVLKTAGAAVLHTQGKNDMAGVVNLYVCQIEPEVRAHFV